MLRNKQRRARLVAGWVTQALEQGRLSSCAHSGYHQYYNGAGSGTISTTGLSVLQVMLGTISTTGLSTSELMVSEVTVVIPLRQFESRHFLIMFNFFI